MVVGTLSLGQKGQTSGFSGCSGCSEIVVFGGGTLFFVQIGQTRGCSGCSMHWISGMWWLGHCL